MFMFTPDVEVNVGLEFNLHEWTNYYYYYYYYYYYFIYSRTPSII